MLSVRLIKATCHLEFSPFLDIQNAIKLKTLIPTREIYDVSCALDLVYYGLKYLWNWPRYQWLKEEIAAFLTLCDATKTSFMQQHWIPISIVVEPGFTSQIY